MPRPHSAAPLKPQELHKPLSGNSLEREETPAEDSSELAYPEILEMLSMGEHSSDQPDDVALDMEQWRLALGTKTPQTARDVAAMLQEHDLDADFERWLEKQLSHDGSQPREEVPRQKEQQQQERGHQQAEKNADADRSKSEADLDMGSDLEYELDQEMAGLRLHGPGGQRKRQETTQGVSPRQKEKKGKEPETHSGPGGESAMQLD